MGQHVVAARLNSNALTKRGQTDWRQASLSSLEVEVVSIPDTLRAGCLKLLEALGLVFGCIDVIKSEDGDYVFLEVNQMGQFLWLEEANPQIPLLDAFCQFLQVGHAGFCYEANQQRVCLADVLQASQDLMEADRAVHIPSEPSDLIFQGTEQDT